LKKDVLAESIYAVGIDDAIMVKRIEQHPGKLVLRSDNKDYEPVYLSRNEMDVLLMPVSSHPSFITPLQQNFRQSAFESVCCRQSWTAIYSYSAHTGFFLQ